MARRITLKKPTRMAQRQRLNREVLQHRQAKPGIKQIFPTDAYLPTVESNSMVFDGKMFVVKDTFGRYITL